MTHADKRKSTIKIKEEFWAQLFCVKQLGKDILGHFFGQKIWQIFFFGTNKSERKKVFGPKIICVQQIFGFKLS